MPGKPKREITEELERRAWDLRLQGWNQFRIAAALDVDQSTVSRMLERVRGRLARAFEGKAAEMRAEQTEQLQELLLTALTAFEASKQDAATRRVRTITGRASILRNTRNADSDAEPRVIPLPDQTIEECVHRGQTGNAAFLKAARDVLGDLRALWGLEAPDKAPLTAEPPVIKALIGVDIDKI